MKESEVELYCRQRAILGEGPLWSRGERALYWLDIWSKRLFRRAFSETHDQCWSLPNHPGCLGELEEGSLAIAMGEGIVRWRRQSGATEPLYKAPRMGPAGRFNDGKVDPKGRFWVGTMQNNFGPNGESMVISRSDGTLLQFGTNASVSVIETNIGIPNALAWSPSSQHFYFADSLKGRIYSYDCDIDAGTVRNKRSLFESPQYGTPDGCAMDADGCLWNARWDAGLVIRITPDGKVDRKVRIPAPRPTSCAFGGSGLNTLFVTSARVGLAPSQLERFPLSGSVFAIHGIGTGMEVPMMKIEPAA